MLYKRLKRRFGFHLELQRAFSSRASSHGGKRARQCGGRGTARASHLIAKRKLRGASRAPPPRVRDVHSIRNLFYFTSLFVALPKMFYTAAYVHPFIAFAFLFFVLKTLTGSALASFRATFLYKILFKLNTYWISNITAIKITHFSSILVSSNVPCHSI